MFKLYYCSAIDTCVEEAFKQIEEFNKVFNNYTVEFGYGHTTMSGVKHPIEIYGAGFNDSPIIPPEASKVYKGVISAYDYRMIRQCDILLVVTNLETFAAGTMMELEYARSIGLYIILMVYGGETHKVCYPSIKEKEKVFEESIGRVKNIFLETYCNKIIYSMEELEEILKDLTQ
jgi:hypothetical protein